MLVFPAEHDGDQSVCEMTIPYRGNFLVFACDDKTWKALPEKTAKSIPIHADFQMIQEIPEETVKVYQAIWDCKNPEETYELCVKGEEMAELFVNQVRLHVSFWSPHVFTIKGKPLLEGQNALKLVFTGSRANRYGHPVPYGLDV